jgi:hypothetical protein
MVKKLEAIETPSLTALIFLAQFSFSSLSLVNRVKPPRRPRYPTPLMTRRFPASVRLTVLSRIVAHSDTMVALQAFPSRQRSDGCVVVSGQETEIPVALIVFGAPTFTEGVDGCIFIVNRALNVGIDLFVKIAVRARHATGRGRIWER